MVSSQATRHLWQGRAKSVLQWAPLYLYIYAAEAELLLKEDGAESTVLCLMVNILNRYNAPSPNIAPTVPALSGFLQITAETCLAIIKKNSYRVQSGSQGGRPRQIRPVIGSGYKGVVETTLCNPSCVFDCSSTHPCSQTHHHHYHHCCTEAQGRHIRQNASNCNGC